MQSLLLTSGSGEWFLPGHVQEVDYDENIAVVYMHSLL